MLTYVNTPGKILIGDLINQLYVLIIFLMKNVFLKSFNFHKLLVLVEKAFDAEGAGSGPRNVVSVISLGLKCVIPKRVRRQSFFGFKKH